MSTNYWAKVCCFVSFTKVCLYSLHKIHLVCKKPIGNLFFVIMRTDIFTLSMRCFKTFCTIILLYSLLVFDWWFQYENTPADTVDWKYVMLCLSYNLLRNIYLTDTLCSTLGPGRLWACIVNLWWNPNHLLVSGKGYHGNADMLNHGHPNLLLIPTKSSGHNR